ncbi:MAG: 4-(cytidine 5'-diphospho)-2-C-methyl-D-erythritol kinase [Candidatus Nanopelagicales bacterium]
MTVRASAPAKTNVVLSVGHKRADGYHGLATIFQALDLRDEVVLAQRPAGAGVQVSVSGADADAVPADHTNLAAQATYLMAERYGVSPDVQIAITKAIPVAGGMAGGSADAAATLVALNALWHLHLSRDALAELGLELGSDVPFSLHGGTMLGLGRGEQLTPVLSTGVLHWVVAVCHGGLSTPSVYREFDRLTASRNGEDPRVPDAVLQALRTGDVAALGGRLANDLQPAALHLMPSLAQVLSDGSDAGALGGIVSGSGPTAVFLARDREHAIDLAVLMSASGRLRRVHAVTGGALGATVESTDGD